VVKERLEEMESELKTRSSARANCQMEKDKLRAKQNLNMEGLRNQLVDQAVAVRDENARLRMSCLSCAR